MWHVSFLGLVAQFSHFSRSVVIARWSIISMFLSMLPFTFYGLCSRFTRQPLRTPVWRMPPPLSCSLLRDRKIKLEYTPLSRIEYRVSRDGLRPQRHGVCDLWRTLISGTAASRTQRRRQNARATQLTRRQSISSSSSSSSPPAEPPCAAAPHACARSGSRSPCGAHCGSHCGSRPPL